jgi:DNA-binding GntR family transcriptional regulator
MKKTNEADSSAQTLTNRAYLCIKDLIMSYALKPGEVLSEIELARKLQMSRTPIHQALLHLKRDGFLEDASGTGWKVYSLSLVDIREIFAVKIAIENIIMEEAALNENASKEGIRLCLERMQKAASDRDIDEWIKLDHELHDTINALAGNSRAVQIDSKTAIPPWTWPSVNASTTPSSIAFSQAMPAARNSITRGISFN